VKLRGTRIQGRRDTVPSSQMPQTKRNREAGARFGGVLLKGEGKFRSAVELSRREKTFT